MAGNDYCFPFEPYHVQKQFMDGVYKVLDEGKIGLFESPTGTGKSLSLICGSLKWLHDYNMKALNDVQINESNLIQKIKELDVKENGDWISSHQEKVGLMQELKEVKEQLDSIAKNKERRDEIRNRKKNKVNVLEKPQYTSLKKRSKIEEKDEIVEKEDHEDLVNYTSEPENDLDDELPESNDFEMKPKIVYASRTHSQLTQFVSEVKRTSFAANIHLVSLGSRSNLCINHSVSRLNNVNLINEKCLELQRQSDAKKKCCYLKQDRLREFRDDILAEVQDIEEAGTLGKLSKNCPYFGLRLAIPEADMVVLPYNILLHASTRKSVGLNLKDSVVIIDEAHNLLETIAGIFSVEVYENQILQTHYQLTLYITKYNKRLSPKNLMYLKQIAFILNSFTTFMQDNDHEKAQKQIFSIIDFLVSTKIDNINLFKVLNYCNKSQIARKLQGFSKNPPTNEHQPKLVSGTSAFLQKLKTKSVSKASPKTIEVEKIIEEPKKSNQSSLYLIIEFIRSLLNQNSDGRVMVSKNSESAKFLKFLLLNPANEFKEIVQDSRAIILAGGTMEPITEFIDHLFKPLGVPESKIHSFNCGHVIPKENLISIALCSGPSNKPFEFSFTNRSKEDIMLESGRLLVNLVKIISGGIVCFFPSYEYENKLFTFWTKNGFIKQIEEKGKSVFREPKKSNDVTLVLNEFATKIHQSKAKGNKSCGAVLLSVVGGKMSEGINFSDDLGRCIIMFGLPFPNINSPELKEKMNYLDKLNRGAGKMFYNNLCMKAVNQSIGRAIRHKDDYALILLVDKRYATRKEIHESLPKWIRDSMKTHEKFGPAFGQIRDFFNSKVSS